MAVPTDNPDASAIAETVESAERQAGEYADFLKRLKTRLSRARTALASKPAVAAQVAELISDLRGMKAEPVTPITPQLIESLERHLRGLSRRFQEAFPSDLRQCCERAGLEFKALAEGFGVGPFFVGIDVKKETASFQYAKVSIEKDVPLNTTAIVEHARSLKAVLLDPPVDLSKVRSQLHEAMRVAVARTADRGSKTELRVELPVLFREMGFIRQSIETSGKRASAGIDYSLPRFVLELKQFIQSDENVHAGQQFRLEPAVIENAKNPKKSIFIPRDICCGFGEGTYYQAIVFHPR